MSVMATRRASLDEGTKERIKERVKELLKDKDGSGEEGAEPEKKAPADESEASGEEDGKGMPAGQLMDLVFGDDLEDGEKAGDEGKVEASARVAMDFPNKQELEKYLKDHPDADRSRHRVVEEKGQAKEDEGGEKKDSKPEGEKTKTEEKPEPKSEGEKTKLEEKPEPEGEKTKPEEKPEEGPSTVKSKYFSSEEMALPKTAQQRAMTQEHLYEDAKEAQEKMMDLVDRGKGLDKKLGAKVYDLSKQKTSVDLDSKGPVIIVAPMKSEARAKEKVEGDYKGDWSMLVDVVRSSIAVDTIDDVGKVVDEIKKSGVKIARRPKDRFAAPTEVGYMDVLMNVEYDNGHIGEIQVHLKSMIKAKAQAHKYYETVRTFEADAKKQGRTTMSAEEQRTVDSANGMMRSLYGDAYKRSVSASSRVAVEVKYYDYEGFPAKWEWQKFPMVSRNGHQHVEYDMFRFVHGASRVEKDEFDEMMKGHKRRRSFEVAASVAASVLGDRVAGEVLAARGYQVVRKDKDVMRDTGGSSKGRAPEPDKAPGRDERNPWRTKNKTREEKDKDMDAPKKGDPDLRLSFDSSATARELARWPRRFIDAVEKARV